MSIASKIASIIFNKKEDMSGQPVKKGTNFPAIISVPPAEHHSAKAK